VGHVLPEVDVQPAADGAFQEPDEMAKVIKKFV
jgi:hypothetical protein